MKITNELKTELSEKLRFAVKYQETYDEVYDHLITAIENTKGDSSAALPDALIDAEFGGVEALKQMEQNRVKLVTRAMQKKHWEHIKTFFNWPLTTFTLGITIAAYFIASNWALGRYLISVASVAAVLPLLFVAVKKLLENYRAWYLNIYQKPSLKSGYISNAAILSTSMFNLISFCVHRNLLLAGPVSAFYFCGLHGICFKFF